jgi:hypothetical protein
MCPRVRDTDTCSYLIREFLEASESLTASDAARIAHIDQGLVSRWRSGKATRIVRKTQDKLERAIVRLRAGELERITRRASRRNGNGGRSRGQPDADSIPSQPFSE